jgi:hypothetical protein
MTANVLNYFNQPSSDSQDNKLVLGGSVETDGGQSLKKVYLTTSITDISTAGQIYVVSPVAGTITKIYSVINGAIATANSILTPKIAGTAITGGAITVAFSGSAAGDVDSSTPTAANAITAGAAIEIETDGGSANTVEVVLTIEITLS